MKKKPIIDPRGQWAHPGRDTIVPTKSGAITMRGVSYPVYGQDETGYAQMMYPGRDYIFPGQMVYERPMMAKGGYYDCPDQEKDPVTGKCKAEVVRGREAAAANKAANKELNAWAKEIAAIDKANARQEAAATAGQLTFDYDWSGYPVEKADKKAAIAQYKQFFQQNPNVFMADDTSGYSPEQKYIIASKLKQRINTPVGSKLAQKYFGVDPRYYDLQRMQSELAPKMGGWGGLRNWLFNVYKKDGGQHGGLTKYQTRGEVKLLIPEKLSYDQWKKKYDLKETPDYNLKRAWELGYTPDKTGHLPSVDNQTGQFLKAKGHPTLKKELDWYNSPEAADFRSKNAIDSSGKFFKYVPKRATGYLQDGGSMKFYQQGLNFPSKSALNSFVGSVRGATHQDDGQLMRNKKPPSIELNLPEHKPSKPFFTGFGYTVSPVPNVKVHGVGMYGTGNVSNKLNVSGSVNTPSVFYPGGSELFMSPRFEASLKYRFQDGGELSKAQTGNNLKLIPRATGDLRGPKIDPRFQGGGITYTWDPSGSRSDDYMLKRTVTPYTKKRDIRKFTQAPTDPSQVDFISNYANTERAGKDSNRNPTSVPYQGEKHWNIDRFIIEPAFSNVSSDLQNRESTKKQMKQNVLADMYKYFMVQNQGDKKDAWKQAKQFMREEINPRISGPFYEGLLRGSMPLTGIGMGITDAITPQYMYWVDHMMKSAATGDGDLAALEYAQNPVPKSKYKKFGMDWLMNYKGLSRKEAKDYLKKSETYPKSIPSNAEPTDLTDFKQGGQHGGLDRWFAEKWVDVKSGKACGRQKGEKRKGYPACRPSRRISEDTPKTSGELSSSEREKFKRSKTSSERINYQHRRKEDGGEINEQDMANKPNNPALWSRAKSLARQKFDVYPSAYANGWAAKWYKGKGGTWRKAEYGMEVPYMQDGGKPEWLIEAQLEAQGYSGDALQQKMASMAQGGYIPEMPFGGLLLPGIKKRIEEAKPMLMQMAPMLMGAPPMPMMAKGGDPDGEMALGQIDASIMKLQQLRKFIQPDSDLEPWVNSKLTLMDDYASAVSDYMMYNPEAQEMMMDPNEQMEMMRDGGIPQRYKSMGFTKVGVKKNSTRPGKKWMVLAKKGDQYKVVHGGYDGMKDFSQHGSEKRKTNFWNRMGGKNSSKATDPFSPLYWHKRFGTWENGGQPFLPQAQDGKILLPKEQDFPDYETYAAALDQYLASFNPVQGDTTAVVQQQVPVSAAPTDQQAPFVLKPYEGSSIYDFMVTQGKAPEYSSRQQLAKDLGIENYRGTAEQNLSMLDMLRSSPDKLSTYTPVLESKKAASTTNNKPSEAQKAQPKPQPKKQNPAPPKLETQTEDDYVDEIAATIIGLATIGGLGIAEARQALRNIEEGKYNLSGKAKAKLTKAVNSLKSQSLVSSGQKVKEVSKWYNSLPARQKNILKSLDLAEISGDIANTRPGTALKNVEAYSMLQEAKQEDAVLDAMKAAEEAKALRSFNAQKAAAVRWGKPIPTFPKLAPIASETKAGTSIFKEGLNAAMETPWLRNSIKFMKRLPLRFQTGGEPVPDDDTFLENTVEWIDPTGISSWDDVARTFNNPNSGAFDRFLSVAGALPIIGKIGKGAKVVSLASDGAKAMSKTKKVTNAVGKGLDIITLSKPQRWIDNKVNPFTRAFGAMTSKAGANIPRAAAVPANILVDIGRSNRAWNAVDNFIPGGTSMVPQGEVVNLITPEGRVIRTTTADPRVRQLYDQNLIDTTQGGYDEKTSGWRLKSGSPYGNYDYFKKSGGSTWYNNTFYQKGGSIVNYLASKGMAFDKESRKKLAEKMGIKDYNFSANKNLELLEALRQELKDSPASKSVKSSKSTSKLLSAPSMLRGRPTFTPDSMNFTQSVLSHMNSDKQLESGFVVDKRTNTGHVIKDGKIQESFPVLTGLNPEGTENPYSVAYLNNNPSNRVTPAGTYSMIPSSRKDRGNRSGTIYGEPGYFLQPIAAFSQKAPNSKNIAIHTTYDPAFRDNLYNMSPEDRYASYGCINCRPKNIGDLTSKYFPQGDTLMVLDPQKNMYDFDFMERLQQGRGLIKKAGGEIEEGDILEVTPAQAKALREAGFEFTTE